MDQGTTGTSGRGALALTRVCGGAACPTRTAGRRGGADRGAGGQVAALEAAEADRQAEMRKLATERDMRQAAKYFAGETNW
ncbi:hypothetical protein Kisp01_27510 [Kineosporia sp. NBRC 101677]|nr:hypothetical protein Kisp01_27510 [Kineosporia sp. NBRC 101677]